MVSFYIAIDSKWQPWMIECEFEPSSYHDLAQAELIYDEMSYIVVAEYAKERNFEEGLRYWKLIE